MFIDLTGSIHGKLQVVSLKGKTATRRVHWNVHCLVCTKVYSAERSQIVKNTGGCQKCSLAMQVQTRRLSHVGETYGNLYILQLDSDRPSPRTNSYFYIVKCLLCDKKYSCSSEKVFKNVNGCIACTRKNTATGPTSVYWSGGKYISSSFLSNFKRGAKKRNLEFTVTIEDLDRVWESQNGKCVYSGVPLVIGSKRNEQTASLDRIDSSIGYVVGNVQFVHKDINCMKWDFPEEKFLRLIKEIYEFKVNDDNNIYEK
jgi:hypothetical protein